MVSPGAPACTAYSPAGTPSAGTSSTSAGSASATPAIVPVSRTWPSGSPACGGVTRTPPGSSPAGWLANGWLANGTASAAVSVPAASPASSSASARGQQRGGGHHRAAQVGHRGGRAAGLLGNDSRLPEAGPGPAVGLRDEQPGAADLGRQHPPQRGVVGLAGLGPGQHVGPVGPLGQQRPDRVPQVLLVRAVQQVRDDPCRLSRGGRLSGGAHRGRSFHGILVSVRGSVGRPRTRSAMMFRRISEVPPSIELPRERR